MSKRVAIVGGGILGVALARALASRGDAVTVFEKEDRLAAHQTGRNSGVVHAGLYYAPGSLKAILCARGRSLLREYCQERGIPYRALGKLVVAVSDDEVPALAEIERRSLANSVPGLRRIGRDEIRDIEPHATGVAALHSPETAAVDYAEITRAFADDVRAAGGTIHLGTAVTDIAVEGDRVRVSTADDDALFDRVVACAGLHADVVARMVGAPRSPKILPFRGEYWGMRQDRANLVRGMIYPVPDPRFPFLGVHFTRGVDDSVHIGPNAVPALAREGYRWTDVSIRDTWASLTWPGATTLARKHWQMGMREVSASLIKPLYFRQAQRFIPELRSSDLDHRVPAGVRAQAWAEDGSLLDDFAVDQVGPVTVLRNAPSPAATSSLAIAEYVIEHHLSV